MKDKKLIKLIKDGEHKKVFTVLYEYFPVIKTHVCSKGGSDDEAKDIFQEALLITYKNIQKVDFKLICSIQTYVYSVCKNIWNDHLRKAQKWTNGLPEKELEKVDQSGIEEALAKEQKFKTLDQVLLQIGERCLDIFKRYYYQKQSMREIAEALAYSSEKVAKNQKYKCLERARKIASEKMFNPQKISL